MRQLKTIRKEEKMKLYLTPLSHFARKVRIIIKFYQLECQYIDIGRVTETSLSVFAGNPLLTVPVLTDEESMIIESDNIISYLLKKFDLEDKLKFKTDDVEKMNIRAILNGIMSNEVKLIQGKRSGIAIQDYAYFTKAKLSLDESLNWIELQADKFTLPELTFDSILLVCAIEHIKYFETTSLEKYKQINRIVDQMALNPLLQKTNPFVLKPK
jgi:glutathione S-transferase